MLSAPARDRRWLVAIRFPKPVSLGGRAVGWVESEVEDWLTRQIQSSREAQSLRHK